MDPIWEQDRSKLNKVELIKLDKDGLDIINDIIEGVKKGPGRYVEIIDRKDAIKYCIDNAIEGDVIVLAGKGHEDYHEVKGVKHHMDERELIQDILAGR